MRSERSTEFVIGDGGIPTDIAASVDNIILHWQQILVSDTSEEQLKRYFNFQLKRIGTDPDAFSSSSSSDSDPNLIRLIGYLLKYATPYIDFDIIAPDYYITYVLNRQMTRQNLIKERLATKGINPLLRSSVDAYLQNFEKLPVNRFSTYSALNYYEIFIKQFAISTWPDKDLDEWLSAELMNVNFNSLRFLNAIREQLLFETKGMSKNERRHFFLQKRAQFSIYGRFKKAYDTDWPSINEMLLKWIGEELDTQIVAATGKNTASQPGKIGLELPVPQIALLARLFLEGGIFSKITLTGLVDQISHAFSSKYQACISARSLSKNCYTSDQVTAARVRGHLQQMIAFIDKNFFPLIAVISAGILFHPGN